MIVIVTTIDVYLAVYKDVEIEVHDEPEGKPGWLTRWRARNPPEATTQPAAE
jgi:hypothetical protein